MRTTPVSRLALVLLSWAFLSAAAAFADEPSRGTLPPRPSPDKIEEELRPLPLRPIPDDPPPHEGAMIDIPHVIAPTDLLIVEVLEALPGRPISGERLVRPDGTINLGFYGAVHVRGLTLEQAKVKVVLQLRKFLKDETLGLVRAVPYPDGEGEDPGAIGTTKKQKESALDMLPPAPRLPPPDQLSPPPGFAVPPGAAPFDLNPSDKQKPRDAPGNEGKAPEQSRGPATNDRRVEVAPDGGGETKSARNPRPAARSVPGRVASVSSAGSAEPAEGPVVAAESGRMPELDDGPTYREEPVPPAESDRVFVDIAAFNSSGYVVQGDVATPGKLPSTGNETVLDALTHAGWLISTADPKNIRLIRPAQGGKPSKVYPIDLHAIVERGDPKANLQVFPGDRIVVGRDALIRQTERIDRLHGIESTVVNSMLHHALLAQMLENVRASGPKVSGNLTPDQREKIVREWVDFWWSQAAEAGGTSDEKAFKEMLNRSLRPPTAPKD